MYLRNFSHHKVVHSSSVLLTVCYQHEDLVSHISVCLSDLHLEKNQLGHGSINWESIILPTSFKDTLHILL